MTKERKRKREKERNGGKGSEKEKIRQSRTMRRKLGTYGERDEKK